MLKIRNQGLLARRFGVAAMALLICAGPVSAADSSDAATDKAKAVAAGWLLELDAGQYEKSWSDAAPAIQHAVSRAEWASKIAQVRGPFGAMVARELQDATYTHSLPGAPDGDYVVIRYHTSFANKADATETVTPMKTSDGLWHVSGYYVR
jgi:opacity protein-like surface antigen